MMLSGIDDPELDTSIRRAASRSVSTLRSTFENFFYYGIAWATATALSELFSAPVLIRYLAQLVSIMIVCWILGRRQNRRLEAAIRDILRSTGRCEQCGYQRHASNSALCPECGR